MDTLPQIVHPSVEKVVLRPPQSSLQRPATSFDVRGESKSSSNDIKPLNGVEPARKSWSMENLAQLKRVENEISQARVRLRSTRQPGNPRFASTEQRKGRPDTDGYDPKPSLDSFDSENILNELDNLLVGTLDRVATTAGKVSYKPADNIGSKSSTKQSSTPQTTLRHSRARASLPVSQPHLHSTSRHWRSVIAESYMPASSKDTNPLDYVETPLYDAPVGACVERAARPPSYTKVATERTKAGEGADGFV